MKIRQQVLDLLRVQLLAVAGHFVSAETDDVGNPVIVGRQAAQRKIFVLEHCFETRTLFSTGGIGLVAAVAFGVVDSASGRLLRVEAEFSVGLAALHIAGQCGCDREGYRCPPTESTETSGWCVAG